MMILVAMVVTLDIFVLVACIMGTASIYEKRDEIVMTVPDFFMIFILTLFNILMILGLTR